MALAPYHRGVTSSRGVSSSHATSFAYARTCGVRTPHCKPRSLQECQVTSWSRILQDATVADSADQTWRGATRKDNVPCSDPAGTAPWAEGLRCPSASCQVWGEFRCPPGMMPNGGGWMPPLAQCRVLRDSPCGTLPAGMGTLQPRSKIRETLRWRTGLLPFPSQLWQQRHLHFTDAGGEKHLSRLVSLGIRDPWELPPQGSSAEQGCPATQSTPRQAASPVIDWGKLL